MERCIALIYTPKDPEKCEFVEIYQTGDHHPKFEAILSEIKDLVPKSHRSGEGASAA